MSHSKCTAGLGGMYAMREVEGTALCRSVHVPGFVWRRVPLGSAPRLHAVGGAFLNPIWQICNKETNFVFSERKFLPLDALNRGLGHQNIASGMRY